MDEELSAALNRVYEHFAYAEFKHEAECIENGDLAPGQFHIAGALRIIGRAIGRNDQEIDDD